MVRENKTTASDRQAEWRNSVKLHLAKQVDGIDENYDILFAL